MECAGKSSVTARCCGGQQRAAVVLVSHGDRGAAGAERLFGGEERGERRTKVPAEVSVLAWCRG